MTRVSRGEQTLRDQLVTVCHRLWERGLVAGQDGNVSARLPDNRVLVTPAGFSKVDVTADDLVVIAPDGALLEGRWPPSSEVAVHLRAYARRSDVNAVVHAHPPTATALGLVGESLSPDLLPEVIVLLGPVPLVPYATPGTPHVADQFDPFWAGHDAFLMANHGALTLGTDLRTAHQRMESLEHTARIVSLARTFGVPRALSPHEVRALEHLRNVRGREGEASAVSGSGREQ